MFLSNFLTAYVAVLHIKPYVCYFVSPHTDPMFLNILIQLVENLCFLIRPFIFCDQRQEQKHKLQHCEFSCFVIIMIITIIDIIFLLEISLYTTLYKCRFSKKFLRVGFNLDVFRNQFVKELMRGHFRKVKYFQACGNQSTTVFVITNLNHQYSRIWNRAIIKSEIEKTNKCQGAGGRG